MQELITIRLIMMKYTLLFFSAFIFTVTGSYVFAQESDFGTISSSIKSQGRREWKSTVEKVKSDTQLLLRENDRLNSEYNLLKGKLSDTHDSLGQLKQEIATQERDNKRLKNRQQRQSQSARSLQTESAKFQKTTSALEAENREFRQRLADIDAKNRKWEKQLSALETQKRELMLDIRMKNFSRKEMEQLEEADIRKLKGELNKSQREEEKISRSIRDTEEQNRSALRGVETVKRENRDLKAQIKEIERQTVEKKRKNELLRRENERLSRSSQRIPAKLVKEKRVLKTKVARLSGQLETVRDAVSESRAILNKRRMLMDEIADMDAENQRMRQKISGLTEKISGLKDEIDVLESTSP